jgi:hypothetical protein
LRPGGLVFAFEPSSIRARRTGSEPIPAHQHEFRMSGRWLAERMTAAGFEVDEVLGRRIAVKLMRPLLRSPSLRMFHAGDTVDRALRLIPGVEQLGEIVMLRAHRRV